MLVLLRHDLQQLLRMCLWTEWFYVGDLVADEVSKIFVLDVEAFCDVVAGKMWKPFVMEWNVNKNLVIWFATFGFLYSNIRRVQKQRLLNMQTSLLMFGSFNWLQYNKIFSGSRVTQKLAVAYASEYVQSLHQEDGPFVSMLKQRLQYTVYPYCILIK